MEYRQGQRVFARIHQPIAFPNQTLVVTFHIRKVGGYNKLCEKCRARMPIGTLHAVWDAWHFCLNCVEPLAEVK